ncbi:S8 family serine peptidase [Nitriliruptoraceae bacterium ZYF776]|nr:S8 family serine peptidase [Profundirhabdus halotolerans]
MLRKLGSLGAAALLASTLLVPATAAAAPEGAPEADRFVRPLDQPRVSPDDYDYGAGSEAREYFVRLSDAPAAAYTGGVPGQSASVQRADDGSLDYRHDSAAARSYREHLVEEQVGTLQRLEASIGRDVELTGSFTVANHGFTLELTPDEARELGTFSEVRWIQQVPEYELHTDAGPAWLGARGPVWEREGDGLAEGDFLGEGVVVGIIDTGINPSNPAFAAVSADGYEHENPRGEGNYVGSCDPTNVPGGDGEGVVLEEFGQTVPFGSYYDEDLAELCNDKLIGMWGYAGINGGSPIDYDGHGSHTAGTAAGNFVDGISAVTPVPVEGNEFDISGVAPRANIISYAACCTGGGLYSAVDQIVVDDVDVVNYSIGSTSPTPDLLQDPMTWGFLVARANGIHVANSAGNSGPSNQTIGSPSDAPWLTVVGSSTHDRIALNVLEVLDAEGEVVGSFDGKGVSGPLTEPTEIVYAGDRDNALCGPDVWDAGEFDGEIVLCDRGEFGRVQKSEVAAAAGAGGFILVNDEPNAGSIPGSLNGDAYPIPGLHLTFDDGLALKDLLEATEDADGTIAGTTFVRDDAYGDIMSVFSSRGPNTFDASVLSPHVTAPGHDILAPYGSDDDVEYQFISGTSMSGPHVAGAFALLHEAFGEAVSPAEAQSALQLTARTDVRKTDGQTPADWYDMGSGHVDVAAALATGLLLDVDPESYVEAIVSGDTAALNLPSLAQGQCVGTCTWTRTFTGAPGTGEVAWEVSGEGQGFDVTVEPSSFTLAEGETQELTVTADVSAFNPGEDRFGIVELTTAAEGVSDAHLPVIARPTEFGGPTMVELGSEGYVDGASLPFRAADAPDLQVELDGFAPGTLDDLELPQDPTPGNPFQNIAEDGLHRVEVPEGTSRFSVVVGETTSPDIDLFVGLAEDEDGPPVPAELVCESTAPSSAERCDLVDPEPGTYWVLVQNWEASAPTALDATELITAVVPSGEAFVELDAPAAITAPTDFDVELAWALEPGPTYWFARLSLRTDADAEDAFETLVDLTVEPELPVADAGGPYTVVVGQTVTLDGSASSHPEDLAIEHAWDVSQLGIASPQAGETITVLPTVLGEREVTLTVTAEDGTSDTDTATVEVLPPGSDPDPDPEPGEACEDVDGESFTDVAGGPHGDNVGCVAAYGIALGKGDGSFDPAGDVRRDQMASFLARLLQVGGVDLPDAPASRWPDVTDGPHALAIDQLTELGIIAGRSGGERFDPAGRVTRAQMASFLVRAIEEILGEDLDAPRSPFTDTAGSVHAGNIDVAYALGVAEGRTATTFAPQRDVRRDQMASFLARTLDALLARDVELTPLD